MPYSINHAHEPPLETYHKQKDSSPSLPSSPWCPKPRNISINKNPQTSDITNENQTNTLNTITDTSQDSSSCPTATPMTVFPTHPIPTVPKPQKETLGWYPSNRHIVFFHPKYKIPHYPKPLLSLRPTLSTILHPPRKLKPPVIEAYLARTPANPSSAVQPCEQCRNYPPWS